MFSVFNFKNTMDRKAFNDRRELVKEYNSNKLVKVEYEKKKDEKYPEQDNDKLYKEFNDKKSKLSSDMHKARKDLINPYDTNDEMPDMDVKYSYIEKDNYNKFLNMKSSNDILHILVNTYFWSCYNILVIILVCCKIFEVISNSEIIPFDVNWGLLFSFIVIYVLFRSFNRYSSVKISF